MIKQILEARRTSAIHQLADKVILKGERLNSVLFKIVDYIELLPTVANALPSNVKSGPVGKILELPSDKLSAVKEQLLAKKAKLKLQLREHSDKLTETLMNCSVNEVLNDPSLIAKLEAIHKTEDKLDNDDDDLGGFSWLLVLLQLIVPPAPTSLQSRNQDQLSQT